VVNFPLDSCQRFWFGSFGFADKQKPQSTQKFDKLQWLKATESHKKTGGK